METTSREREREKERERDVRGGGGGGRREGEKATTFRIIENVFQYAASYFALLSHSHQKLIQPTQLSFFWHFTFIYLEQESVEHTTLDKKKRTIPEVRGEKNAVPII